MPISQLRFLLRANFPMLVGFGIFTIYCAQRSAGFMIVPIALIGLLYQTVRLLAAWRVPEQRAVRLTALLIVLLSVLIVGGCHAIHHQRARAEADRVVAVIERFYAQNQRYPNTLDELGFDPKVLRQSLGWYGYNVHEGNPFLVYSTTFVLFDKWAYDFGKNKWAYEAD